MSQIKDNINIREQAKIYKSTHIVNSKVEWLIEEGKPRESIYFKGETGDRYTIYIFTKQNKNLINITSIYNTYSHDSDLGDHLGYIKDYILCINANKRWGWREGSGDVIKQLMRQGIGPRNDNFEYKIRYCRSAYFMKTHDGNEFNPWSGIKIDLKTGLLVNKPTKEAKNKYNTAKNQDKAQRRRNYIANRENTRALKRYRDAGGDTESARGGFKNGKWTQPEVGVGLEKINWDMVPIDDVFKHRNATLRSNIIEHYGMNAILATLKHEVVNEDTIDGRLYKLLNVDIPDFSNARQMNDPVNNNDSYKGLYLEMINPSTGESHFEGVPNVGGSGWGGANSLNEATVKAALSWRDNDMLIQSGNSWSRSAPTGNEYVKPIVLK